MNGNWTTAQEDTSYIDWLPSSSPAPKKQKLMLHWPDWLNRPSSVDTNSNTSLLPSKVQRVTLILHSSVTVWVSKIKPCSRIPVQAKRPHSPGKPASSHWNLLMQLAALFLWREGARGCRLHILRWCFTMPHYWFMSNLFQTLRSLSQAASSLVCLHLFISPPPASCLTGPR